MLARDDFRGRRKMCKCARGRFTKPPDTVNVRARGEVGEREERCKCAQGTVYVSAGDNFCGAHARVISVRVCPRAKPWLALRGSSLITKKSHTVDGKKKPPTFYGKESRYFADGFRILWLILVSVNVVGADR